VRETDAGQQRERPLLGVNIRPNVVLVRATSLILASVCLPIIPGSAAFQGGGSVACY